MKRPVRGHFDLVLPRNVPNNTTVTTRTKNKSRQIEAAKRAKLIEEMQGLTGGTIQPYARSIDGVVRRWTGVKNHGPS